MFIFIVCKNCKLKLTTSYLNGLFWSTVFWITNYGYLGSDFDCDEVLYFTKQNVDFDHKVKVVLLYLVMSRHDSTYLPNLDISV